MGKIDKDKTKGLYGKYYVERINDKKGKHKNCQYFVLDLVHDKYAYPALIAYREACKEEYPQLADDLFKIIAIKEAKKLFPKKVNP